MNWKQRKTIICVPSCGKCTCPPGPTGPTGARGATGPTGPLVTANNVAYQNLGTENVIDGGFISFPTLITQNGTLITQADPTTFNLAPNQTYLVNIRTTVITNNSNITSMIILRLNTAFITQSSTPNPPNTGEISIQTIINSDGTNPNTLRIQTSFNGTIDYPTISIVKLA